MHRLLVKQSNRPFIRRYLDRDEDERALEAVRAFNPYDLYSKSDEPVDVEKVKPYYQGLIAKFFPPVLNW